MEAKLPAAWTSHGRPPIGHLPTGPKERPPPVIVAKLNPRRAAPTSGRKPMPRIEAAAIIQMRRLQEGSDADGATVARPKWTGFSPLDDMLEGNTTPPTGKQRPVASPSPRLSPKNPLARTPGREAGPPASLHRHRRCPAAPRKPLQRGIDAPAARSSRTAASAVTPSVRATHSRTWLRRSRPSAAQRGRHRPSSSAQAPADVAADLAASRYRTCAPPSRAPPPALGLLDPDTRPRTRRPMPPPPPPS